MKFSTLLALTLMIALPFRIFSQISIGIGQVTPPITITDWVQNIPEDTSLTGKTVVVDFWATWCGPCIKAIPHYNDLAAEFQEEEDVLFLSMTYEHPRKIQRTLERIDFRSAVVTDQNNRTQEAFGIGEIPYTLIIDAAGKLAWAGHPESLTTAMVKQVLDGRQIATEDGMEDKASVDLQARNLGLKEMVAAMRDSTVTRMFKLIPTTEKNGLNVKKMPQAFYKAGADLKGLLSELLTVPEYRIDIPASLTDKRLNIVYLDKEAESAVATRQFILDRISEEYGVTLQKSMVEMQALSVGVKDPTQLDASDADQGAVSSAGDKLIFTAQPIEVVWFELEESLQRPLLDRTGLAGNYDFIIPINDEAAVRKALKSYGLEIDLVTTEVAFYEIVQE